MASQTTGVAGSGYGNVYVDSLIWGCRWTGGPVTYAFGPAALTPYGLTSQAWTSAEQNMFRAVLGSFSNVCGITFAEVPYSTSVNIVEWKVGTIPGASNGSIILGFHEIPDGTYTQNWGVFSTNGSHWATTPGSLGYSTVVHEIGHGLGLAHPHDGGDESDATLFPGVTNSASYGQYDMNQSIWSVMSYNSGWKEAPVNSWSYGDVITPMALDIAALQQLYGVNTSFNADDNNYFLPGVNAPGTGWSCIWDAAGTDTISNAGRSLAATIDLRAAPLVGANAGGYVSKVAGIIGGFTIANGVIIENAVGGNGHDILIGNEHDNYLYGGAGNDVITGFFGTDFIDGGDGVDTLVLSGSSEQYLIAYSVNESSYYIQDLVSDRDGTDWLESIERILFSQTNTLVEFISLLENTDPTVTSFNPADGAVNVGLSSNISVTFSEWIQRGVGTIEIRSGSAQGALFESFNAASSPRLSITGNQLVIDPVASFSGDTNYFVIFSNGVIKDMLGNNYVGSENYDFKTIDTIAPTVSVYSPTGGAVDVFGNGDIVLTFSESIQRGVGNIEIRAGSAKGTVVESFNTVSSNRISIDENVLTIDPIAVLAGDTRYFVVITHGAIKDLAGNSFQGTTTYEFRTLGTVSQVLYDGASNGLDYGVYRVSSGVYAVSESGLHAGDSAVGSIKLFSGSKAWAPLSGMNILAVEMSNNDFSIIYSTGTGAKTVYSSWLFNSITGISTAKPEVLSLAQLLAKENTLGIDLNQDAGIGDAIAAVLYSDPDYGVYRLTSGVYAIAEAGFLVTDIASAALNLRVADKGWIPVSGTIILSVRFDGDTYSIIFSTGSGTKKVFSSLNFNAGNGESTGKAVVLGLMQLLAKEAELEMDLNGDSVIGDGVAEVLHDGFDYGIYRLSSGRYVLAGSNVPVGDMPFEGLNLMVGTKAWAPVSGGSILAIELNESVYSMLYSTGTGSKKVFSSQAFSSTTGVSSGKAVVLTLAQLLAKEGSIGVDLNGDTVIGDAVSQVLYDGAFQGLGYGVYKLSSGVYAIGQDGLTTGDSAVSSLILTNAGKPWVPLSGSTILAVEQTSDRYTVLYSSGTSSKKTFNSWTFDVITGISIGKPVVLNRLELMEKEQSLGVDLDGDSIIGDGILRFTQLSVSIVPIDDVEEKLSGASSDDSPSERMYLYPASSQLELDGEAVFAPAIEQSLNEGSWDYI